MKKSEENFIKILYEFFLRKTNNIKTSLSVLNLVYVTIFLCYRGCMGGGRLNYVPVLINVVVQFHHNVNCHKKVQVIF